MNIRQTSHCAALGKWVLWIFVCWKVTMATAHTLTKYRVIKSSYTAQPKTLQCARQYSDLRYTGASVFDDGSECEGFPRKKSDNSHQATGYNYLLKSLTIKTISPPMRIFTTPTKLYIPGVLGKRASIQLAIVVPNTQQIVKIEFKDKDGLNSIMRLNIWGKTEPQYTEISHVVNGKEMEPENATFPFVNPDGSYTLTFLIGSHGMIYARVGPDSWFSFDTTGRLLTSSARMVWIYTGQAEKAFYLEQFAFKLI